MDASIGVRFREERVRLDLTQIQFGNIGDRDVAAVAEAVRPQHGAVIVCLAQQLRARLIAPPRHSRW